MLLGLSLVRFSTSLLDDAILDGGRNTITLPARDLIVDWRFH